MSRINWGFLTSIGLVAAGAMAIGWFTYPKSPSLKSFEYGQPRNEKYHPGGQDCYDGNLNSIRDSKIRINKSQICDKEFEEYRQSSDDLIQQTRAANAAEAQTTIASQALWMGWFQTIGGLITLAAAAAAAIYARSAAIESRRAANVAGSSHDALISAERAIIRVTNIGMAVTDTSTDIVLSVKNYGRSPAVVLRSTYVHNPMKLSPGVGFLDNDSSLRVLVPHGGDAVNILIGSEQFSKVKQWYVAGSIEYETVLQTYVSYFCWKMTWYEDEYGSGGWSGQKVAEYRMPQDS